jgi:glycosyltransferase involved in cell wall biosynthesis
MSAVSLATGESCTLSYSRSEALRTRLGERLKSGSYELVMVTSSNMIQYTADIDPSIPLLMDFGELDSEWWISQAKLATFPGSRFFRTEGARLRGAEAAAARRAAACVAASEKAAATIRSLAGDASVTVIPNGIDSDSLGTKIRLGKVPTVVFCASLGDASEVDDLGRFCEMVLPVVRTKIPGVRFVVVGRESVRYDRSIASVKGVEVVASSTEIRSLFHSEAVAVAPLWSTTDVRASVLEPMAAGIPVVATTNACERAQADPARDLEAADDPLDFARLVIRLLDSASLRREVGERGRRFVEANSSWGVYATRLMQVIDQTRKGGGRPGSSQVLKQPTATVNG